MRPKWHYELMRNHILDRLVKLPETKKFYKTEAEYKAMHKRLLELEAYFSGKVYEAQKNEKN